MTIAFRRVILPRYHDKIVTGASVSVLAEIVNSGIIDTLVDPTSPPVISIFDSTNVQMVIDQPMTRVSIGLYNYDYRTPFMSPLGVYTGNLSAVYNQNVARLEMVSLFKTVRVGGESDTPITLTDVTYLIMRDQTGVLWYVYINVNRDLMIIPTVPTFALRNAVSLNVIPVYWIEIDNTVPLPRYIYPDITGSLHITDTQPLIGTGIGNPVNWLAEDGQFYKLSLNIMDDIIVEEV